MQITVLGASGKVGALVVEAALRRGYTVKALVHTHDLFSPSNKLIILKGDIYNPADIDKALRGSSAVISCLGSWGTPQKNVLTAAMRLVLPAMREHKIRRIVTLTGTGAKTPNESSGAAHAVIMKLLRPFPAGKVFEDGEAHLRLLAASKVAWTTIRSPVMTHTGSAAYVLKHSAGTQTIARKAVAAALLDQLDATDFICQAPCISRP